MPIFRVKSVKIYTGQKKFTRAPPVAPVTNMRYVLALLEFLELLELLKKVTHSLTDNFKSSDASASKKSQYIGNGINNKYCIITINTVNPHCLKLIKVGHENIEHVSAS